MKRRLTNTEEYESVTPETPYIKAGTLRTLMEGIEIAQQPAIAAKLKLKFGLNYQKLPDYYAFDRYLELLDWLRVQLYPHESEALGFEKIGRNITQGMFCDAVGYLLKISAEILGIQQGFHFFFDILGSALWFGKIEILEHCNGYIRFMLWNVPGSPDVTRGMILETMEAAKARQAKITYSNPSPNVTEFEVFWQD